jgi:hypothetical protein
MAQPWMTVAWAFGPRDRTTLPPQRCAGWSAACGAAWCPWDTVRARSPAAGRSDAPAAGSTGEGSTVSLLGQSAAAGTDHASVPAAAQRRAAPVVLRGGAPVPQSWLDV